MLSAAIQQQLLPVASRLQLAALRRPVAGTVPGGAQQHTDQLALGRQATLVRRSSTRTPPTCHETHDDIRSAAGRGDASCCDMGLPLEFVRVADQGPVPVLSRTGRARLHRCRRVAPAGSLTRYIAGRARTVAYGRYVCGPVSVALGGRDGTRCPATVPRAAAPGRGPTRAGGGIAMRARRVILWVVLSIILSVVLVVVIFWIYAIVTGGKNF
jgi:hypothetical protein